MELDISFGKCRSDTVWKPQYLTWGEFLDRLKKVRRTAETMTQYDQMDAASQSKIKDGAAFVGGLVRGGRRKKESIDTRSLITLDADYPDKDFLDVVEMLLGGSAYAIYSTHSHRPGQRRKYRFIAPCSRRLTPDEYSAVSRKLAENIGMTYFDATTFDVNRLMYFPSCSRDAEPELIIGEGDPINVDAVLGEYADWRDPLQWPTHPKAKVKKSSRVQMEDPETKQGIVGSFCRCYTISQAIEAFLEDQYTPTDDTCTRYTYAGGTSYGGLVVYDDKFAYSHHESDPISGREVNAFDLVRLHKFGDLDNRASEKTNVTKLPSYTAMLAFASNDVNVRKDRLIDIAADFEDDDFDEVAAELEINPKTGKPLPTAKNIELILTRGEWRGILAYDAFGNTEVVKGDLPWRRRERRQEAYDPWLGADEKRMLHWFSKQYDFQSKSMIQNAFAEVVHLNKFHPIIDYIESQEWDGKERVNNLFIDYLGADNTQYTRSVTRKMLLAAVKRLYDPGCKFDYMLVLVGPQGAHKSSILQTIARQWFSDSLKRFETKEAGEHLQSAWIFEFGELAGMNKTEVDEIKHFITKRSDKYRVAYDRVVSDFPRKCVFFGTTNNWDFLKDPTGNRRFWPVAVNPEKRIRNVFKDLTDYEVGQLWAEVLRIYKSGESLELPDGVREEAEKIQGVHMEDDQRFGVIQEWLDTPIEDDMGNSTGEIRQQVCAMQILVECMHKRSGDIRPWEAKEICNLMRRMPDWVEANMRKHVPLYGKQTVFERTVKGGQ